MREMRALFLDIDGVMCLGDPNRELHREPLDSLKKIADNVENFIIVLSSDWRKEGILRDHLTRIFEAEGIPRPRGKTPVIHQSLIDWSRWVGQDYRARGVIRTEEIHKWLEREKDFVVSWAAVDDTTLYLEDGFFQTQAYVGLTEEIANDIIRHLNKESS